jgi:hypothetical protein
VRNRNPDLLSKSLKKVEKLSRFKSGWSTTSTELPVLDFAHATLKRLKSEKKIAPRDGSMLVYLSLVSDLDRCSKALIMG